MEKRTWLRAAAVRALRTAAQSAAAAIGTAMLLSQVDWRAAVSTAALSAILSLLTSLAGLPEAEDGPGKRKAAP